jgi:hypothetical protein
MGIDKKESGAEDPTFSGTGVREVWDEQNEASLVNCLANDMKDSALAGRKQAEVSQLDFYELDEVRLFAAMSRLGASPSPSLNRLRTNLWIAFDRARTSREAILAHHVAAGVCTVAQVHMVMKNPMQAAWLFTPPRTYVEMLDETLEYGMMKLRAILDMPEVMANGTLNQKLVDTKVKIIAMMDLRKNGAPTQKIEQKNLNVSVGNKNASVPVDQMSMEKLEERAAELRRQNLIAQNLPPAVVEQLTGPKIEVLGKEE